MFAHPRRPRLLPSASPMTHPLSQSKPEPLAPGIYPYPFLRDGCVVYFGLAADRAWVGDVPADGVVVTEEMAKSLLAEIIELHNARPTSAASVDARACVPRVVACRHPRLVR